jgi:hypothetical protein
VELTRLDGQATGWDARGVTLKVRVSPCEAEFGGRQHGPSRSPMEPAGAPPVHQGAENGQDPSAPPDTLGDRRGRSRQLVVVHHDVGLKQRDCRPAVWGSSVQLLPALADGPFLCCISLTKCARRRLNFSQRQ